MVRWVRWAMVAVLGCVAAGAHGEEPTDARWENARAALEEATRLEEKGEYAAAIARGEHALALREAALGGAHPDVAACLDLLGNLYRLQGNHAHAERLARRALAIWEEALGKDHPEVARSLNTLAILYWSQGLYAQTETLLQRALAVRETSLGPHHFEVAISLNNLGVLYRTRGEYAQAEPLLQRALAIQEEVLGKQHPEVAFPLNNLALLYGQQGSYARAEPLYQRALAIQEAALDRNHPDIAYSLTNLASLYHAQGLYARAEPLYQRALAIRETAFGRNHPEAAQTLTDLARLYIAQDHLAKAVPLLTRAFSVSEERLRKEALDFSEERLARFLQYLRADEELLYALLRAYPEDASVRRLALAAVLLRKGRSVEETSNTSRTVFFSLGAQDRDTFERLRGLRTQQAALSLEGPGSMSPAGYQQRLKELADQGDALEADLARRSAPLRALTALPPPSEIVDRVAAALPQDSALVEFVAYEDRPLVPKPGALPSHQPGQLRYLALVLFPDARIRALDLGPAAPIDHAASTLRDALASRSVAYPRPAQALYSLAFRPLLPLLGKTSRLFLSPDGQLALVAFAALHDGKRFLIDSFDFSYLTSGKDLLPGLHQDLPVSRSVVVLADPAFSAPPATSSSLQAGAHSLALRSSSTEHLLSSQRTRMAKDYWAPLPGTRREAETIQRLLPQAQLFLGPDATTERLLRLPTPGILHIATHGFFFEDGAVPSGSRAMVAHSALGGGPPTPGPPDPLLRSGLVLARAQARAPDAPGTSLVTALELAGLDLWGTELVVLSACDTGRGDVKLGQGVYGLRRALVVAGAETVVMSLWKVNDDTTGTLMEGFYRNLLEGKGGATALRDAMRSLRETHPHPSSWAPFIALGRDAPLRLLSPGPQHP